MIKIHCLLPQSTETLFEKGARLDYKAKERYHLQQVHK
jgi:hypothetical protein